MNFRSIFLAVSAILAAVSFPLHAFSANQKPVIPSQQWRGSVADLSLRKAASEVILTEMGLKTLWKAWNVEGPMPEVDFSRNLVVVQTTSGSLLRLSATLDEQGNLRVLSMATKDLRPGFRYVIALLSRQGVKTFNGKKLSAETENSSSRINSEKLTAAPQRAVFQCQGGKSFTVEFVDNGNSALLHMDGKSITLPQVPSGSGARYSDGKTTLWTKGDEALVEINGKIILKDCKIKK
jgi:membrane-bound inhibitor of C-type lysozyme